MKNILKLIMLLTLVLLTFSCRKNIPEKIDSKSTVASLNDSVYNVANTAIEKGDTIMYKKAYRYFSINHHDKEFLYYSITMAHVYSFSQAYFDTYTILTNVNDSNKLKNNILCDYYLLKSYEGNNHHAKDMIKEIYLDKGLKVPTSISVLDQE